MNKRKIVWEYWKNPFGDDSDEFVSEEEADVGVFDDDDEKDVRIRPVFVTPMGFVPIHSFQSFTEHFQFWVGNTNFDITPSIRDTIEQVPGVEILDILTRYSFRIAVGKVFDGGEVKAAIQRSLDAMPPIKGTINPSDIKLDKEMQERISMLQKSLKDKFPFWAIYILPNGEIDIAGANTQEGYDMHLELYKSAQQMVGGVIYQHA